MSKKKFDDISDRLNILENDKKSKSNIKERVMDYFLKAALLVCFASIPAIISYCNGEISGRYQGYERCEERREDDQKVHERQIKGIHEFLDGKINVIINSDENNNITFAERIKVYQLIPEYKNKIFIEGQELPELNIYQKIEVLAKQNNL